MCRTEVYLLHIVKCHRKKRSPLVTRLGQQADSMLSCAAELVPLRPWHGALHAVYADKE
jgi:hypothetical protein